MSLADFPRLPLLFGPFPVHRLKRRTRHLGGQLEGILTDRSDRVPGRLPGPFAMSEEIQH
jgi:1-aminocyclopropane-1-carboxylate deaminase/D-cysteine desulfhydrase-like pyridoxal-dependent ACC family enzyme